MYDVLCPMSDVRCPMSDDRCRMCDYPCQPVEVIGYRLAVSGYRASGIGHLYLKQGPKCRSKGDLSEIEELFGRKWSRLDAELGKVVTLGDVVEREKIEKSGRHRRVGKQSL